MPAIIAAIGGMLLSIVGSMVGRVMVALGISVITYTGISATIDALKADAIAALRALPPELFSLLAYMKVGVALSIITSAITARLVLSGLTSGTFKRWVIK